MSRNIWITERYAHRTCILTAGRFGNPLYLQVNRIGLGFLKLNLKSFAGTDCTGLNGNSTETYIVQCKVVTYAHSAGIFINHRNSYIIRIIIARECR